MANKQKVTFEWDKRNQKLIRKVTASSDDKASKRQTQTDIVEHFNKEAAIKLKSDLFMQLQHMEKFYKEMQECKELNEKKEELPMYDNVMNIMKALRWENDKQARAQFESMENQMKQIKEDYEALDKALPNFK